MGNKNIIILGAARAGKSTLARMLHKKYNYSIVSIDSFVSALKEGFPELGITHANTENKFKLLPQFVFSYINKITYEYPDERFVLEGWHVYPKDIVKLFNSDDFEIVCLGYTEISCEDFMKKIRECENENSYTKQMTDERLKKLVLDHIEYSKILKKQCEENGIKFYDTSFNRDYVLNKVSEYLIHNKIKGEI